MTILGRLLLLLLLSSSTAVAAPSGPAASDVEVLQAEFGLFHAPDSGKPSFEPSRTIPLKDGQEYGWFLILKTSRPTVTWREEFTLPSAPQSWGTGEDQGRQRISVDRTTSTTERTVPLDERGLVLNRWAVAPGDPAGRYEIRVFVDGVLVRTFEFEVERP